MKYYSTNLKAEKVDFGTALLKGLADDGGLYMPETFPVFSPDELEALKSMEYPDIAYAVLHKYLADEIPADELKRLVDDAYDFAVPLEPVTGRRFVMRLDQGPTASFKDFAARMMGRLMQYYLKQGNRRLLILTATSGDTGSAIANAFYGLDNIEVVVLFPTTEVTARQRKQMTTLGRNIRVLSLDGKFDDCQALVKLAFNDRELDYLELSSANSINIGRLLPQAVYYFHAWARLSRPGEEMVVSVPSGNFGDLMGGLIAKRMGLPVHRFVVATNENDEFPLYWENGEYHVIAPSRNCISSAMNVGHPSNVARLIAMYGGVMDEKGRILEPADLQRVRADMFAVSINDGETEGTIRSAYQEHKLILEPHGAVAWAGLSRYLAMHEADLSRLCVSIETAHPAKFPEKIRELLGFDPELPPSLQNLDDREEFVSPLQNDYPAFKTLLQGKYSK
ncbi:MAG: threonine synthase [Deltaproteobacteria bacterium HGW-Deltaproteobacteria-17]|nr:MAG: threonine synthase [Deltaproteobacteria bacterium HGW-Deltaproteobacteria-17]